MSTATDIALGFGKFLAAATPDLVRLWMSKGQDNAAALAVIKRAMSAARTQVDEALDKKHGK